jgi:hypothetical protein
MAPSRIVARVSLTFWESVQATCTYIRVTPPALFVVAVLGSIPILDMLQHFTALELVLCVALLGRSIWNVGVGDWLRNRGRGPARVELSAKFVKVHQDSGDYRAPIAKFVKWRSRAAMVLIYHQQGWYLTIPSRSLETPAKLEDLHMLLRETIGEPS